MSTAGDRIRFNVGGKIFETTATTLASAGRSSMLGALLDDDWRIPRPPEAGSTSGIPEYFIDRNPSCFGVLLDLLRTGELHPPLSIPDRLLRREALFYGLLPHLRAALWGPLDGNRLRLAHSVPGLAPWDGTAVRAAPDGGCCIAHGRLAHVYDWAMEELPPLNLDYQQINDVGYIDPSRIILTARQRQGISDTGGMALFQSSSGELSHRFEVYHNNELKSFTGGSLSFNSQDSKIFASCKGRLNEHGIGIWDQVTGQHADFFYEQPGCPLGDADKLQWMYGKRCLMVATLYPRTDNCFIGLLDLRMKTLAWSWSEARVDSALIDKRVLHAVAIDDGGSICVVNQYDDLGFLDVRMNGEVRWRRLFPHSKTNRLAQDSELCNPKLAVHNEQLFCSTNDNISVFCGPEWVLTSTLRSSCGGSICDFSIGGDRLFALHSEENVFDVWETTSQPIL